MERKLSERERWLDTILNGIGDAVIATDAEGTIAYVNKAFERHTGHGRDEVIGKSPRLLKSGKHDVSFYSELWSTIEAGRVWRGHFVNKKKDGTLYTVDTVITPVRDAGGVIVNYIGLQHDVTLELQLEEQYRQAQKMEAMGQLTAGIADDFNNLLTAINGFAELMQVQMSPGDPLQELLVGILNSGRRGAYLVKQLLAFSRIQIVQPQTLTLNAAVARMENMLSRIIGEHIQIETVLAPDLWPIRMDPTQTEQVILNLAVNARDAMPAGGKLTIETSNVTLDEAYGANRLEVGPGSYVLLSVSDSGIGMGDDVKSHLFEPFFTTKEVGKGTGLGLAAVDGIVRQNGGHVSVYSEEGHGTTFKIYLPRSEESGSSPPCPAGKTVLPTGDETILLVEDDQDVRGLVRRLLESCGYVLMEAGDGQEGLQLAASHTGPIHLLLTDVVMPRMSGKELAHQLSQARTDLRVLFMSGYTEEAAAQNGVLAPGAEFLQKPFTPSALVRKVRDVLDS